MDETRYSRNVALFGIDGQRRLSATKVAIVGLGGLGSHIAQQLAYLGILDYGLIDGDIVTSSSLNRVIGAVEADAVAGTRKVIVSERMIMAIQPTAHVVAPEGVVGRPTGDVVTEILQRSDVIFGCLDKETPRLCLTELSSTFSKLYIDAATDTGGESETWYGGRVIVSDGTRCLSCLDMLDQGELRRESMSDDERRVHDDIYGITRAGLGTTGPAVVSVNGVVASLAVTEFMVYVTGLRPPSRQLTYRGDLARLTVSKDPPRTGCWYCAQWRAGAPRSG